MGFIELIRSTWRETLDVKEADDLPYVLLTEVINQSVSSSKGKTIRWTDAFDSSNSVFLNLSWRSGPSMTSPTLATWPFALKLSTGRSGEQERRTSKSVSSMQGSDTPGTTLPMGPLLPKRPTLISRKGFFSASISKGRGMIS